MIYGLKLLTRLKIWTVEAINALSFSFYNIEAFCWTQSKVDENETEKLEYCCELLISKSK